MVAVRAGVAPRAARCTLLFSFSFSFNFYLALRVYSNDDAKTTSNEDSDANGCEDEGGRTTGCWVRPESFLFSFNFRFNFFYLTFLANWAPTPSKATPNGMKGTKDSEWGLERNHGLPGAPILFFSFSFFFTFLL
jgi:hypothetical protein